MIRHATERSPTFIFYWDEHKIETRGDWVLEGGLEGTASLFPGELSADRGKGLADLFLERVLHPENSDGALPLQ